MADFAATDLRFKAFEVQFLHESKSAWPAESDSSAPVIKSARNHHQLVSVKSGLYKRFVESGDRQWFQKGHTVSAIKTEAGQLVLLAEIGDPDALKDDQQAWMFSLSTSACLPLGSGLSQVAWTSTSRQGGKGKYLLFDASYEGNPDSGIESVRLSTTLENGKAFEHVWKYSDHKMVDGIPIPTKTSHRLESQLWSEASYNIEKFRFLEPESDLPPYPWDEVDLVGDNRREPHFTVSKEQFIERTGPLPKDLKGFLAALDRMRPFAEKRIAQLEARAQSERQNTSWADPTTISLVALPLLIGLFFYLRSKRG